MEQQSNSLDTAGHTLYAEWRKAAHRSGLVLNQVKEDMTDVAYVEAEKQSRDALWKFLCKPTSSLCIISLKLQVACHFGDYFEDALNPANNIVAPRAIVSALNDLQSLIIACQNVDKDDDYDG